MGWSARSVLGIGRRVPRERPGSVRAGPGNSRLLGTTGSALAGRGRVAQAVRARP
jgi:hypothetical protein